MRRASAALRAFLSAFSGRYPYVSGVSVADLPW